MELCFISFFASGAGEGGDGGCLGCLRVDELAGWLWLVGGMELRLLID